MLAYYADAYARNNERIALAIHAGKDSVQVNEDIFHGKERSL